MSSLSLSLDLIDGANDDYFIIGVNYEVNDEVNDEINSDVNDPIITGSYSILSFMTGSADSMGAITKDSIVGKLIPDNITECSLCVGDREVCISDPVVKKISVVMGSNGSAVEIMDDAKKKLNCDGEKCVLKKLSSNLGHDTVKREISLYLKVDGVTDNTLLSNVHIDNTMLQWSNHYSTFYPWNFNMLNYASYSFSHGRVLNQPDTLATINFADICEDGAKYNCGGCVINSDVYQGGGTHWMSLFVDIRTPPWTVEFFNSSGNSPAPEWVNWMEKTKLGLQSRPNAPTVVAMKSSSMHHQKSRSECGLYSLFYIWARINKIPVEYFAKNRISDELMFEFRHHLFDDPNRKKIKSFDWAEYSKSVNIKWE